jgi:hypothetical protein
MQTFQITRVQLCRVIYNFAHINTFLKLNSYVYHIFTLFKLQHCHDSLRENIQNPLTNNVKLFEILQNVDDYVCESFISSTVRIIERRLTPTFSCPSQNLACLWIP